MNRDAFWILGQIIRWNAAAAGHRYKGKKRATLRCRATHGSPPNARPNWSGNYSGLQHRNINFLRRKPPTTSRALRPGTASRSQFTGAVRRDHQERHRALRQGAEGCGRGGELGGDALHRRHGRTRHCKSGLPDLQQVFYAEVGQARLPMPSTSSRRGCPA